MSQLPVALQLYSVRDECTRNLPNVLKSVAAMGYDGVEFAGYYGYDATQLKQMLDDLGLKVAGAHVGLDTLLGDKLEESIAFHQTLGNEFLIVPGLAEQYRNSTEAWKKTADTMNGIAAALKPSVFIPVIITMPLSSSRLPKAESFPGTRFSATRPRMW